MPIAKKIIKFLSKIKYELIEHKIVYTAYDKAQTLKVPEKIVGKTLVVKINGDFTLVLISANQLLDKAKFKKVVNDWRKKIGKKPVKKIGFVSESWMKKNLKGVKVGAIPPFGNLWGFSTFVDKALLKRGPLAGGWSGRESFPRSGSSRPWVGRSPKIIVNGGDYNVSIRISSSVFKKLIPDLVIGNFGKKK